jgi:hypothetical protein
MPLAEKRKGCAAGRPVAAWSILGGLAALDLIDNGGRVHFGRVLRCRWLVMTVAVVALKVQILYRPPAN